MKNKINNFQKFLTLILSFLIILGVYLSFIGGYGSDEDTLALIGAYESMLGGKELMASRFTPYPVAEIGIGFLSYNFGSWAANLLTFCFAVMGFLFFFLGLKNKYKNEDIFLFLTLCLSSPILFFDNIEPIDYSWAFFFLSLGIFFLKKNYFELAVIFFGISIGTRINFVLFVPFIIFFFSYENFLSIYRKLILFFCSFFVGGLFYLPIWFEHGFALDWLTAVTPNNQGIIGLLARFLYKSTMSLGIITLFFILLIFFQLFFKKKINLSSNKLILGIIISNLILFFFIPAEISYLQPFLISLFFLCFIVFEKKIIFIIIFLNLFSWFLQIDFLSIKYKSTDICNNVEATSAKIDFHLEPGNLFKYLKSREKINCWVKDDSIRSLKILNGEALK